MRRALLWQRLSLLWFGAIVAFICLIPFIANPYYLSLGVIIGIQTLLTLGLCLLMGYTGQVSLGHAAFYGMGAFISAIATRTYDWNPWLAMFVAMMATGGIAYVVGLPIFRLRGNYLAMATLAFGVIIYILLRELHQYTGGPSGLSAIPDLTVRGFAFDNDFRYYYLVWAFALGALFLSQNIVRSRVGRALRSVHGNEAAAQSLGVDVARVKVSVFVLSAMYASLAGSLYAHYVTFVSPQPFEFMFSVRLVVMVVIGGLASVWGSIFGTASITLLSDQLHRFGELDTIVFGGMLMLVMIFMPSGLTLGVRELWEQGRARLERGVRLWARASSS